MGTRILFSLIIILPSLATADDLPGGPGRDIIMKSCNSCHQATDIAQYRFTKPEWVAMVDKMSRRGAGLTSSESDIVADYLFQNFPKIEDPNKVNVNKASARQLQDGLGLTEKEAQAILDYREKNPAFKDWGDLLSIYGVDGRKIQAAKDKMSF